MLKIWIGVLFLVGGLSTLLGSVSLFDSIINNDYSIASIVSILGFGGVGAIMLITSYSLKRHAI